MSNASWKCSSNAYHNVPHTCESAIWCLHLPLCLCVSMDLGLGAVGTGYYSGVRLLGNVPLLLWGMQICFYCVTCHSSPVVRFCTRTYNQRQPWPLVLLFPQSLWANFFWISETILLPFITKFLTNPKPSLPVIIQYHLRKELVTS